MTRKIAPPPRRNKPTAPAHPSGFRVGDFVVFGRTHGEKTHGRIAKTHGGRNGTGKPLKNLHVEQLEDRGTRAVGTVWRVHPSLLQAATGTAPEPVESAYSVGEAVRYQLTCMDAPRVGVVVRATGNTYEVFGGAWFSDTADLRDSDIIESVKRTDAEIIEAAKDLFNRLSPENLTCDGELTRSRVQHRRATLNRALRALETERGRRISEREVWA